ncbi:MAG TPA: hypothetical protein VGG89_05140 [Candidatus Baltobacteraceae bacterium]
MTGRQEHEGSPATFSLAAVAVAARVALKARERVFQALDCFPGLPVHRLILPGG